MGFKRSWDVKELSLELAACAAQCRSPFNDGWTAMSAKKDLVELKWLIEDLLEDCPTFVGEEQWEQERLIELLKRR